MTGFYVAVTRKGEGRGRKTLSEASAVCVPTGVLVATAHLPANICLTTLKRPKCHPHKTVSRPCALLHIVGVVCFSTVQVLPPGGLFTQLNTIQRRFSAAARIFNCSKNF